VVCQASVDLAKELEHSSIHLSWEDAASITFVGCHFGLREPGLKDRLSI